MRITELLSELEKAFVHYGDLVVTFPSSDGDGNDIMVSEIACYDATGNTTGKRVHVQMHGSVAFNPSKQES